MVISSAFMLIVYLALLAISVAAVIAGIRKGRQQIAGRVTKIRVFTRISRLILIARIIKIFMMKLPVIVALLALMIFMLISAEASTSTHEFGIIRKCGGEGLKLFISFEEPVPYSSVKQLTNSIIGMLSESSSITYNDVKIIPFFRFLSSSQISIPVSNETFSVYVVVGLPKEYLPNLISIKSYQRCEVVLASSNAFCIKHSESPYLGNICCVDSDVIANATIIEDVPLLPVQGYIGTKPIIPPPSAVALIDIHSPLMEASVSGSNGSVTDVLIAIKHVNASLKEVVSVISSVMTNSSYSLSTVWICLGGVLGVMSKGDVPTPVSLVIALVSSVASSTLAVTSFSALVPFMRRIYGRLSLIGLPSWGVTITSFMVTSTMIFTVAIPTLAYVYRSYGGVATLNSAITMTITFAATLAYVINKSKLRSLRNDVYTPVTRRYTVTIDLREGDLRNVRKVLREAIVSNEFFEIEEYEDRMVGNELIVHARMRYVECWGSGLDVNIIVAVHGGLANVYITSHTWSIEEISESVVMNMISLAISRIVGGLKSWI